MTKTKSNTLAKSQFLEISTSVSLELKKSELAVSKQVEITINKNENNSGKYSPLNKMKPNPETDIKSIYNNKIKHFNLFYYILNKYNDEKESKILFKHKIFR
jgi:hypothetical protein